MAKSQNGSGFIKGDLTVLVYPGRPRIAAAENVVKINFTLKAGGAGTLIPMFAGGEFATDFISAFAAQGTNLTPVTLSDPDAIAQLLFDLSQAGVSHVQFNPTIDGDHCPEPVAIEGIIDDIRKRGES